MTISKSPWGAAHPAYTAVLCFPPLATLASRPALLLRAGNPLEYRLQLEKMGYVALADGCPANLLCFLLEALQR